MTSEGAARVHGVPIARSVKEDARYIPGILLSELDEQVVTQFANLLDCGFAGIDSDQPGTCIATRACRGDYVPLERGLATRSDLDRIVIMFKWLRRSPLILQRFAESSPYGTQLSRA